MDRLKMESRDRARDNFEKLAALFPNAVVETVGEDGRITRAIDKDVLQMEISAEVVEGSEERYRFTWPDKRKSVLAANVPVRKTLRPCRDESVDFDNTGNLYIEGDNLDALKLMQETYLGKIKMMYIDPPYNTGSDYVYSDSFRQDSSEYIRNSGQLDDEGNRLYRNTESNGRFHTDWLNMMYPRLKIARDLLTDDGVMFISIDDNEVDNLIKICKEIFGEGNIEVLIWNKESEGSSGTLKQISSVRRIHEYIICAFRNYSSVQFNKIHEALKGREKEFQTANLAVNSDKERTDHPNYFTLISPSGDEYTRQWKWNKAEIDQLIKEDLIYWGSDGHKQPRLIIPTDERRTTFLLSILEYGGTTVGRKDFEALMGTDIEFRYPKPVILLSKLIESAADKDSYVMDFFAGSSTTAQAVMKLNASDGGKRRFIMIQLPELCPQDSEAYKAGYKNICEIGRERIRRAGKMLTAELCENNEDSDSFILDTGFRTLKLDSTNMKDVYYNPQDIQMSILDELEDNIKDDRTPEDLLFQVMLDLGVLPSSRIESKSIVTETGREYRFFSVADGFLTACFDDDIDERVIEEISLLHPVYFVMRDSSLKNDSVAANFDQIFLSRSPDTVRKIL